MAVTKKLTTAQQKTVHISAERNLLGHLLVAAKGTDISLDKLFTFPLSPVPWSLSTPDGCYAKTDKSQLLHTLEGEGELHEGSVKDLPFNSTVVIHGNAMLQSMVHLPETFTEFALHVFRCLPKVETVHFVTDSYHSGSIKDAERTRRGSGKSHHIGGALTKLPSDFSACMRNRQNKKKLIDFILDQWRSPAYERELLNRTVYYVCESKCYKIQTSDGTVITIEIDDLSSSQEEADSRMILHVLFTGLESQRESSIVVRSPDTDVMVLLIYYSSKISQTLLFDTGSEVCLCNVWKFKYGWHKQIAQ
jgi:hypothetical protein